MNPAPSRTPAGRHEWRVVRPHGGPRRWTAPRAVRALALGWAIVGATAKQPAAASLAQADSVDIVFVVKAPASTPADDRLYLSGNLAQLGPWHPGKVALQRADGGRHVLTLRLRAGSQLEFKITRGSWTTVEKGPAGEELANRRLTAAATESVHVEVSAWRDQIEGAAAPRASTLSGDIRHLGSVRSELLGNTRDVWVYLPPSYAAQPTRRYPVVYFHDGQNVFDAATAFIGVEWQADETLQRLAADRSIDEVIAVAVANTPERVAEYTQAVDPQHSAPARAQLYVRFLAEELKPRIDAQYRTRTEREHTALVGSSLGGLVSLYAGVAAGQTFGLVAGMSPVVQWGAHDLEQHYRRAPDSQLPLRVWIDMGTAEIASDPAASRALVDELRRFRDVLVARGYRLGDSLQSVEAPQAAHDERAWSARLGPALRFLLGPPAGP